MNLILCVIIVVVCTAIGRVFAGRMTERLSFFREYQISFTQLTDRMVGINLELYQALRACQPECLKGLLASCASDLKKMPQAGFPQIWQINLDRCQTAFSSLSKADWRILQEGGSAIEALCMNPSEKQAGIYLKRLSGYTAELETEKLKKCKLYNTTGVLAGLMIALLVI